MSKCSIFRHFVRSFSTWPSETSIFSKQSQYVSSQPFICENGLTGLHSAYLPSYQMLSPATEIMKKFPPFSRTKLERKIVDESDLDETDESTSLPLSATPLPDLSTIFSGKNNTDCLIILPGPPCFEPADYLNFLQYLSVPTFIVDTSSSFTPNPEISSLISTPNKQTTLEGKIIELIQKFRNPPMILGHSVLGGLLACRVLNQVPISGIILYSSFSLKIWQRGFRGGFVDFYNLSNITDTNRDNLIRDLVGISDQGEKLYGAPPIHALSHLLETRLKNAESKVFKEYGELVEGANVKTEYRTLAGHNFLYMSGQKDQFLDNKFNNMDWSQKRSLHVNFEDGSHFCHLEYPQTFVESCYLYSTRKIGKK